MLKIHSTSQKLWPADPKAGDIVLWIRLSGFVAGEVVEVSSQVTSYTGTEAMFLKSGEPLYKVLVATAPKKSHQIYLLPKRDLFPCTKEGLSYIRLKMNSAFERYSKKLDDIEKLQRLVDEF